MFHHPLALENLLLHCFEPCLHASGPLRSLNIADVQQPITHLNGLRVSQHLRELRVDHLLEQLVLGSTWGRHDDLDLSEKQLETRTGEICMIRESKPSGEYIMNFYRPKYVSCKKTESGECTSVGVKTGGSRVGGAPRGRGHALHPREGLVSSPDCYLFFYFSKYSKTDKYCLKNCFGVGLLTVPHTYSFSESETFRKVSLMYSSGVTVSITLVSTFMGLPEI